MLFQQLVILNKNLLEEIAHTTKIHQVVKGGTIYTIEQLIANIPTEEKMTIKEEK